MATSSSTRYTVFVSHAGEDKHTVALPLREKLVEQGISTFVDEADMPPGTLAESAMIEAMESARIAIVVLSPEFVARKWPMKELLCFLRRRQDDSNSIIIIPFFYRLSVSELYDEPSLDRLDRNGNPLYHESRFFQRMKSGEPEADMAVIRKALCTLHGIMGVRNDAEASNETTSAMTQKREMLINRLCESVRQALPKVFSFKTSVASRERIMVRRKGDNEFCSHYDTARSTAKLVFNFFPEEQKGYANTPEGELLEIVTDRSPRADRVIAIHGMGGVGKSSLLRGLLNLEIIRERFKDGVHLITIGLDATERDLIEVLSTAVENSGGVEAAREMRAEKNFRKASKLFALWFSGKDCFFLLDDVWQTPHVTSDVIYELFALHESGQDSKVLVTTRSTDVAARSDRCLALNPRKPLDTHCREILVQYSGLRNHTDQSVEDILKRCCGLPLFLAIAGRAVRTLNLRSGSQGDRAYKLYASTLGAHMQSFLHTEVDSYGRLESTLSVSIALLGERIRNLGLDFPLTAAAMHRRLSVLERQQNVPISMLRHLWELKTEAEASIVAREIEQVALAEVEVQEEAYGLREELRLHDSIHLFASRETRKHREEKLGHEAILSGYGEEIEKAEDCHAWWSVSLKADGYIHEHLCTHLLRSNLVSEVVELLLHPEWAYRVLEVCGIKELQQDFDLCISALIERTRISISNVSQDEGCMYDSDSGREGEMLKVLQILSEAVTLSRTFIQKNHRELWFQLYGRLQGHTEKFKGIATYLDRVGKKGPRPWLRPVSPFLEAPGGRNTGVMFLQIPVTCIQSMNDGERVICGYSNGNIAIVNIAKHETEREWKAHDSSVMTLDRGKDGKKFISGSLQKEAKVWDAETLRCIASFEGHTNTVYHVAMLGDESRAVSCAYDGSVFVWDTNTGQPLLEPLKGQIYALRFVAVLSDISQIVAQDMGYSLRLLNIENGVQVGAALVGHEDDVICAAVTSDGRRIISGSKDRTLRIWDISSQRQIGQSLKGHKGSVSCVDVSRDGKRVVSGSVDRTICVWDLKNGRKVCDPIKVHAYGMRGVAFLSDSDLIVSCALDGTVRVWDLRRFDIGRPSNAHDDAVASVSFTSDGKYVLSRSLDMTVRVWDVASGKQVKGDSPAYRITVQELGGIPNRSSGLSISEDTTVRVWNLQARSHSTNHTERVKENAIALDEVSLSRNSEDIRAGEEKELVPECHRYAEERVSASDKGRPVVHDSNGFITLLHKADQFIRRTELTARRAAESFRRLGNTSRQLDATPRRLDARLGSDDDRSEGWVAQLQPDERRRRLHMSNIGSALRRARRFEEERAFRRSVMPLLKEYPYDTLGKRKKIDGPRSFIEERTSVDNALLSTRLEGMQITYGEGSDAIVLATLGAPVVDWALSPDTSVLCVGLWNGYVGIMKLEL